MTQRHEATQNGRLPQVPSANASGDKPQGGHLWCNTPETIHKALKLMPMLQDATQNGRSPQVLTRLSDVTNPGGGHRMVQHTPG